MRNYSVVIRGADDPLPEALKCARNLVSPEEGFSSFDCRFVCYSDTEGRPTMTPTAEARFSYTFWRSARRGRYKLVGQTPTPARIETEALLWL